MTRRSTEPTTPQAIRCIRNIALTLSLIINGCAQWPWRNEASTPGLQHLTESDASVVTSPATRGDSEEQMLGSLVQVLTQVFEAVDTTVQLTDANDDPSTQVVVDQLVAAGFGVQRVPADQGARFLRVVRETEPREGIVWRTVRYEIAIGRTRVSRIFEQRANGMVRPASVVTLLGSRASVAIDDSNFGVEKEDALSRVAYGALLPLESSSPIISLITPELVDRIAKRSASGRSPSVQALNTDRIQVGNLFYQEQSNFGSFLDTHERIERAIIVFANDSMVLGSGNKQRVAEVAQRFVQAYDVINLVGCSNGPTALAIGNEGLALGRAKRVADELASYGIPRDRIVDEGCWAPVSAKGKFPGRGVVMELWRESL